VKNWWDHSAQGVNVCSPGTVVEVAAVLPAAGRIVVARLDGTKMFDADHALYEFTDALRFPAYFGWNWDALSDCLRDLNWLSADGYLLVVENAPRILSASVADRQLLFGILSSAVRYWSSPLGKMPVAFRVVLLCDEEEQAELLKQEIAKIDALPG
jgi:Barstar (barnase inhibitor)